MRLMSGSDSDFGLDSRSGLDSGSGGGGREGMGTYMSSREGWMESGRRGMRRERRKQGCVEVVVGLVGRAVSAHDTRNMFAEYASAMR